MKRLLGLLFMFLLVFLLAGVAMACSTHEKGGAPNDAVAVLMGAGDPIAGGLVFGTEPLIVGEWLDGPDNLSFGVALLCEEKDTGFIVALNADPTEADYLPDIR